MQAKRSLSQNFLTSSGTAGLLADAVPLNKDSIVLEIGPGKGILTRELLDRARDVVAIEKDDSLFEFLQTEFAKEAGEGRLELVHGDALEFNPIEYGLEEHAYSVCANIPYNITGALLKHFLGNETQPSALAFLVQKEVAERICERDGKGSILSKSVQAYGTPRYVQTVKAGSFHPRPNVDSAIIAVENISRKNFQDAKHEQMFFELVKTGFAQKRKQLMNNIKPIIGNDDRLRKMFTLCNLPHDIRAEALTLEQWLALAKY